MAKYNNLNELFTAIATAIRNKNGTTAAIKAEDFPNEIAAIETGAGAAGTVCYAVVSDFQTGEATVIYFEEGMTWDDFINSGYNHCYFVNLSTFFPTAMYKSGNQVYSYWGGTLYEDIGAMIGAIVFGTDVIQPRGYYATV